MVVPAYSYRLRLCTPTHPLLGPGDDIIVFDASDLEVAKISKASDCVNLPPKALIVLLTDFATAPKETHPR